MIIDGRFVDDRLINRLMGECTALASDCRRLSRLPNRDNQAVKAMIPLLKNIRDRDAEWWFRNGSEIKQSLAGVRAMLLVEVIPEEPVPVEPEASDEVVTPVGVVEVSRKPGEDGVFGTKDDEVVIRARRDDGVDVQLRGEDLVRARLAEIGALEGMAVADVAQRREYARLQRIGAGRDGGWWRRNECFLLGKLDELEASLRANELPMLAEPPEPVTEAEAEAKPEPERTPRERVLDLVFGPAQLSAAAAGRQCGVKPSTAQRWVREARK